MAIKHLKYILCILVVLLSFGCKSKNTSIRIGMNYWPGYDLLYLAENKGLLREKNIDAKLIFFDSLSDARDAFDRGQVDMFFATTTEVLLSSGVNNSNRPVIVFLPDTSNGADVIIAKNSLSIIQDLRGKKVAFEPGTLGLLFVYEALQSAAMNFSDITPVPLLQDQMKQALMDGTVDAVQTYPPFSIDISKISETHQIFDSSKIPGKIIDVAAVNKNFLEHNQDVVLGVMQSYFEAQEELTNNPAKSISIMAKLEKISEDDYKQSLQRIKLISANEQASYFDDPEKLLKVLQDNLVALNSQNISPKNMTDLHKLYDGKLIKLLLRK